MAWVKGPFIRFKCVKCGNIIERQINARRAVEEMEELREDRGLVCACCWTGLELRTA